MTIAQRRGILNTQRRCEKCFKPQHANSADCRGPRSSCSKCRTNQHYTSMHTETTSATSVPAGRIASAADATVAAVVQISSGVSADTGALLLTACAYVINGGVRIPIRVFLDPGSTLTVMLPSLRSMLRDPPVGVSDLAIQTFASTLASKRVPLFSIRITSASRGPPVELFAHEFPFEVDPLNSCSEAVTRALARFDQEKPLADRTYVGEWSQMRPALLIGMNQLHKIMHRKLPEPVVDDITAQSSKLGWIVGGSVPIGGDHVQGEITAAHIVCCSAALSARGPVHSSAAKALETLWSLEAVGISDPPSNV